MGLKFPIHPFVLNILAYYRIVPSQFAPVAYLFLAGFMARCMHLRILLNTKLFRHFFYAARTGVSFAKGFITLSLRPGYHLFEGPPFPSLDPNWEKKWVWVTLTNGKLLFVNKWVKFIRRWDLSLLNQGTEYAAGLLDMGSPYRLDHYLGDDGKVVFTLSPGGGALA
ncbi:unnamed protein product [Cuscuta epithymum]|uniref:Transposase (putative) gypsy type domain-containing protein n=1 Tax=Cuscuta epithymum TaxID=186058 RepID=A0AAV0FLD1_9ASTE|nr:unnamed protein product [Cuscuta epithymum]